VPQIMNLAPPGDVANSNPRSAVVNLIVRILRPLVLIMLRHGMTVYEFGEISRWVFARVAMDRRHFEVRHRDVWSMTKSRCAVLTGMTRRQVDRQIALPAPALELARHNYHRGVRVLAAWAEDPGYQDEQGARRILPLRGESDSFECLARSHCRDIPLRAMVDDLEHRGCIVRPTPDTVRFVHENFDGPTVAASDMHAMEQIAENFMLLMEQRLNGRSVPFTEVVSPSLAPAEQRALQLRLAQHVDAFIAEVREEMLLSPRPLLTDDAGKVLLGVYWGAP